MSQILINRRLIVGSLVAGPAVAADEGHVGLLRGQLLTHGHDLLVALAQRLDLGLENKDEFTLTFTQPYA